MKTVAESTVELDRKLLAGEPLAPNEIAHLHQIDALAQPALTAAANRREAVARVNAARDRPKHACLDEALQHMALLDQPLTVLVRAVLRYVQVNKLHQKYRLAKPPGPRFVAKKIKAQQEKYSTHYCK
ncbi:hypothetical protein NH8B_1858 [Pseudogulbenkiania sp. NH8B]|uniref:hypothetical protein n=1 Tax=Pseudogulbenkiania sp. (strain NH8B) TaxID=748280 RepID=UPI0002279EE3|nr:hypothetical protein [Pseudogulbenkiania sp. NH8B]BAK76674.1 hypothetical protein NH8B_1858 [Pseudogulbenkiania sp. NH8B]